MNTWIITDTHFWHKKLTEWNFRPVDFEDRILRNMENTVEEWDTVIHLWDFCIWDDERNHEIWNCLKMHWNIILVKWNHDHKSNTWYYNHWWNFVCEQFTDTLFWKKVTFSHIPITWIDHINIHWHTHWNTHRDSDFIPNPNHIEVALELNWYMPMSLKTLLK